MLQWCFFQETDKTIEIKMFVGWIILKFKFQLNGLGGTKFIVVLKIDSSASLTVTSLSLEFGEEKYIAVHEHFARERKHIIICDKFRWLWWLVGLPQ